MKTSLFKNALVFGLFSFIVLNLSAQQRCATMPLLEKQLSRNPNLRAIFAKNQIELREAIQQRLKNKQTLKVGATPINIPIVFHIVMQNPSVVTDAQIMAQLDTINKDYSGTNGDSVRIPSYFKPFFGKSSINFCLAQRTPTGEPTNGIVRYTSNHAPFSNTDNESVKHAFSGGADAWDINSYLNVWICDLAGDLLGYGTFPNGSAADNQGVVIDFGCIPGGSLNGFNRGKTLTHEIGHYFNLIHTWGDDDGACTGTDDIDDTPNQANSTSGAPTGVQVDACSPTAPGYMYENYMDYTGDIDLVMFTVLQVDRMEAALNLFRPSLLTSNGCVPAILQNNDAQTRSINNPAHRICDPSFIPSVTIFNKGAVTLTSLSINAKIDNGTVVTTNWTGSIASLTSSVISLNSMATPTGNHTLTVYTNNPNGNTDQDNSNDTLTLPIMYFPSMPPPLSESFEGSTFPPDGWDIVNEDGLLTWQKTTSYSKTGNNSVYKNNYEDDINGQRDLFRLPTINLGTADSAFISFQVAAASYTDPSTVGNLFDTLQVLVSKDCGQTYTSIYKKWGSTLVTREGATTDPFFPTASEWRKDSIDISAYLNQGDIMLAFQNTTENENNIFIDDVNVRTVNVNPNLKAKGYLVTPNPTNGAVTVQFYPQPTDLKGIVIFSSLGQKVAETVIATGQANNYYTYDLSRNAPGVYIIRAFFTDKTVTKKIVLVR
ncbi:MAG: M43 family zinc metalloprotease [Bacteroidota bacterium]